MSSDSLAGFAARVTDAEPESRREALTALRDADEASIGAELHALFAVAVEADDPAHRRRALDVAYAVVENALSSLDALPPSLFAALSADETRFRAAAVVRALNCSPSTVTDALDAGDPDRRRAAAQYLRVVEIEDPPVERLEALLGDPEADVRAAAANALLRAIEREQCNDDVSVAARYRDALAALVEATGDDDPRARAAATVAAGHVVVLDEEVPADCAATAARRLGRAVGDADERVREGVREFVGLHSPFEERAPPHVALWYAVGLAERSTTHVEDGPADAGDGVNDDGDGAVEIPESVQVGGRYLRASDATQSEAAVEELIRLGWDPEIAAPTAQRLVAEIADEYHETAAASIDRVSDGVAAGIGVEHGAAVLRAIAARDPERADAVIETLRGRLPGRSAAAPALADLATEVERVEGAAADIRESVETDPTPAAVEALVTAVGENGTRTDLDALWRCAADESRADETRLAAAEGTATLLERGVAPEERGSADGRDTRFDGGDALVDLLASFLSSPDESRRTAAATALGAVGAAEAPVATPERSDAAAIVDAFAANAARADEDADGEEPLAVLAEAAPDRAREAVATLCSGLSPGDDWRNYDRVAPVEEAIAVDSSVGTAAAADLAAAAQPWGIERGRAKALDALATVAENEPAAVADEAAALAGLLTHRSERIRDAAATIVAAVGAEDPAAVPASLRSLAETDREDDRWPMGVVARDAPSVAEGAVDASLSVSHWDDEAIARLLAQVGRTNRDLATDGTDWLADLLWGSVEAQRIAPVVEALADRDPALAVRCVEPLAGYLTEGTPRWERGNAIQALAAVAEHRPEPVRVAVRDAVDRPLAAVRDGAYWQFDDDIDALFAAAGIEAGSEAAESDTDAETDERGAETDERGAEINDPDAETADDVDPAAFWATVDRYRR